MQIAFQLVRILQASKELVWLDSVLRIQQLTALGNQCCQGADALDHGADTLQLCDFLPFLGGCGGLSLLQDRMIQIQRSLTLPKPGKPIVLHS